MPPEFKNINSILVRLPNWVGDIIMATPVFECLRENFPQATITACVRGYATGIIESSPWFDAVIACDDKSVKGLKDVIRQTRAVAPDLAILLPNSTHSFVTARLAGVKRIYGYKRNLRKYFLSGGPDPVREVAGIKPLPMQDYYLEICRNMGLTIAENPAPKLYLTPELELHGEELLAKYRIEKNDRVIGLNPGASFGSSKCWPVEHFASLAERLQKQYQCKIILFTGPGEEAIAEAIIAASKADLINTAPDKIDLAELKPLIKRCDLLVTNDTGPRHYAVSLNVPNVVIMGPTNPVYTESNLETTAVIRKDLPCSPCHKKVCPLQHHECMTTITPADVCEQIEKLLPEPSARETLALS